MKQNKKGEDNNRFNQTNHNFRNESGRAFFDPSNDPLGYECFRLPPFGRPQCILVPFIGLIFVTLILLISCFKQWLALFIFSLVVWYFIFYAWGLVPASSIAFLRPGKKGVWYVTMGFLAWIIYNRHFSRRDFLNREFARILRTAFFDKRIDKIAVVTWLFKPDNIPQFISPPSFYRKLNRFQKISPALPVHAVYLIANFFYGNSGLSRQSPLKADWYYMEWDKTSLTTLVKTNISKSPLLPGTLASPSPLGRPASPASPG